MNTYAYKGKGGERGRAGKSIIRYVRTKWMAPDKCYGIFFVHCSDQVH